MAYWSAEADAVAIRIEHVELAHAPHLVHRGDVDGDVLRDKFRVKGVDIVADEIDHAADYSVASMRGEVQDRTVTRNSQVAGITFRLARGNVEFAVKAETLTVEGLGCIRVGHVKDCDDLFEQGDISCGALSLQRMLLGKAPAVNEGTQRDTQANAPGARLR